MRRILWKLCFVIVTVACGIVINVPEAFATYSDANVTVSASWQGTYTNISINSNAWVASAGQTVYLVYEVYQPDGTLYGPWTESPC